MNCSSRHLPPARLVGGQAVMEGVMMRDGDRFAVAVRKPDGTIVARVRPWRQIFLASFWRLPFIRGFPVLLETLLNGLTALNLSAIEAGETADGAELKSWHLAVTLAAAIAMAVVLFVVVPHLLSLALEHLGLSGDLASLSFHVWDGAFKFLIFIAYIVLISFLPEIRRVFQYHGAEHKVIWNFEDDFDISPERADLMSRLHPRCGTTFLLFVLSFAVLAHALIVPAILKAWSPEHAPGRHAFILLLKLALMVPISAGAYELIRFSAALPDRWLGAVLRAPGLFLQFLTTREPDKAQLEVALVALKEALGEDAPPGLKTPEYYLVENDADVRQTGKS